MHLYTLDRNFKRLDIIDEIHSCIWTDRYYGDSDVQLVVPATTKMINKLPEGIFLGLAGTDEIMILETRSFEGDKLKIIGISLLPWLNNRFVRTSAKHEDRYWNVTEEGTVGVLIGHIVSSMTDPASPYLDGTIDIGIDDAYRFALPDLDILNIDWDNSGPFNVKLAVPFGPLYDAIREIATTYEIGMSIRLGNEFTGHVLGLQIYKGFDRTSDQVDWPVIRFSPLLDSFTDITELQSISALKTVAYAFAPGNPGGIAMLPGKASLISDDFEGFDLRALQVFAEDITTDLVGSSSSDLTEILNARAQDGLINNHFIRAVDGVVVPDNPHVYGQDYFLGDIVEVQGKTGIIQKARVTEYIRVQDTSGERSYPTLTTLAADVNLIRPDNDDIADAILLTCPGSGNIGTIEGTNRYATSEEGEYLPVSGESVWYKIIPPNDGVIRLVLKEVGLTPLEDPSVVVFKENFDEDSFISEFGLPERSFWEKDQGSVITDVYAGTEYFIQVDSKGTPTSQGAPGKFILDWQCLTLGQPVGYYFQQVGFDFNIGYNKSMVYDSVRGRVVCPPGLSGKTHEFYDDEWHEVTTVTIPPNAVNSSRLIFSTTDELVYMWIKPQYSEGSLPGDVSHMWAYDGVDWELVNPEMPWMLNGDMMYVPTWDTIYLVAADSFIEGNLRTFEIYPSDWSYVELSPYHKPPTAFLQESGIYDPDRNKLVIVTTPDVNVAARRADTWEFDLDDLDWQLVSTAAPFDVQSPFGVYDTTANKYIMLVGYVPRNGKDGNFVFSYNVSTNKWEFESYSGPGGAHSMICDYPPYGGTLLAGGYGTDTYPDDSVPKTWAGIFP